MIRPVKSYKHIEFFEGYRKPGMKTKVWVCMNKNEVMLGVVRWYGPWRQYCFFPDKDTVFSKSCLDDIKDFVLVQQHTHKRLKELER